MSSFSSIDAMISKVKERFGAEHKISVMFENCISNTLNTTIHRDEQGRIFVITGDIPACGCAILPANCGRFSYLPEKNLRSVISLSVFSKDRWNVF